jgi:hypothetical protein
VHYAARRRRGEPISTAFVESAVNEIVAKRNVYGREPRRAASEPDLALGSAPSLAGHFITAGANLTE